MNILSFYMGLANLRFCLSLFFTIFVPLLAAPLSQAASGSVSFAQNDPNDYDYGMQLILPAGFGEGEFTFELWIKPDHLFPIGPTRSGPGQLLNWSNADIQPYSRNDWWYEGNFLLDGHNNANFTQGTFSLQFYGGGRVRWLFGDGASAGAGGHWSVGAFPASTTPSLLDGNWHQLTLVRRWSGVSASDLELWIDGRLIARQTSPVRTNMRSYWDSWTGFPSGQAGWFWGSEKQAALGILSQYEDFKGLVDEMRFWSRAKSLAEVQSDYNKRVTGNEPGLVGLYSFKEGQGNFVCDDLRPAECIRLVNMKPGFWSSENAALVDGDISADIRLGSTLASRSEHLNRNALEESKLRERTNRRIR